jgi:putative membrane protein
MDSWGWQPLIGTAVLLIVAFCYGRGWRHWQQQLPDQDRFSWRTFLLPLFFYASLLLLWLILFSQLDQWASHYFFVRVVQHLLLIAWVPALLFWGRPFLILPRGLPVKLRDGWRNGRWAASLRRQRSHLRQLTHPGVVLFAFVATFWLWYDPALHTATLTHTWLRPIETGSLLLAASLYWWHITGSARSLHSPMPPLIRILYTLLGAAPIKLVGLILLFVDEMIYTYPGVVALSGLTLTAQSVGGMIIWIVGGVIYSSTAAGLMHTWLGDENDKPALPITMWATEEAMMAPGLRKK